MNEFILTQIRSDLPADLDVIQWFESQGISDSTLLDFYRERNGGYLLNDALHLYSFCAPLEFDDIEKRNSAFRQLYGKSHGSVCCFGEDTFGNQFAYFGGRTGRIDLETGEFLDLGKSFCHWSREIELQPNLLSGLNLRDEWSAINGEVPLETLLSPKIPFVLGGEFSAENLTAMSWRDVFEFAHSIFEQVRDLPDGTKFEIRFKPAPEER